MNTRSTNTQRDLESELQRLAERESPSPDAIRRGLDQHAGAGGADNPGQGHGLRHRTVPWLAAAAAVVLVVGGIGVTAEMMGSHQDGATNAAAGGPVNAPADDGSVDAPADDAATDTDAGTTADAPAEPAMIAPGVPLPADSQLVAHHPETVTSPVTATAPNGLNSREWRQSPDALSVTFFDDDAVQQARKDAAANPDSEPPISVPAAGYVITADRDGQLATFGQPDAAAPTVTRHDYNDVSHDATLDTAGAMTMDQFGNPARERITWQLADGRWIHVWATADDGSHTGNDADASTASSPSPMLAAFAKTITATPQELPTEALSIGLTVPGLQHTSRLHPDNQGRNGEAVFLCRDGYDPLGPDAQGATDMPCVVAELATPADLSNDPAVKQAQGTVVTVKGLAVHVLDNLPPTDTPTSAVAWADLDNGLRLYVMVPSSAKLSNDDMAALAASVQVSPNR